MHDRVGRWKQHDDADTGERARTAALSQTEYDKLHAAIEMLIYLTQELEKNKINPFEYLTELQKHANELSSDLDRRMPWNYRDMLRRTDLTHPQTHHTS